VQFYALTAVFRDQKHDAFLLL